MSWIIYVDISGVPLLRVSVTVLYWQTWSNVVLKYKVYVRSIEDSHEGTIILFSLKVLIWVKK